MIPRQLTGGASGGGGDALATGVTKHCRVTDYAPWVGRFLPSGGPAARLQLGRQKGCVDYVHYGRGHFQLASLAANYTDH